MTPDKAIDAVTIRLEARLRSDMRPLRARLAQGPQPGETVMQLAERRFVEFEEILERLARDFPTKRGRGRPRNTFCTGLRVPKELRAPKRRGPTKQHDVDDEWLVKLVDDWKAQAKREGRGDIPEARAIANLLYHYAPTELRRQLDAQLARLKRLSDTAYAQKHALRRAVIAVEATRFEWWVNRHDRAKRNLRRRS